MILITGATGNFGKVTIDFLLKKGVQPTSISALVRDQAKAEDLKVKGINLRIGDYDNYESLVTAFNGVDKLVFVSGSDIANRGKQHESVVKAAKEAGVKHILYTSFERKNETENSPISFVSKSHIDTEKAIKASGITYTIFRNNLYMDILPMFFGENVLETGIFLPTGETKSAFVLREDMAEAVANVLTSDGHENKEYSINNTDNVSIKEIAENLNVSYTSPTAEIYTETLAKAGVPAEYIGLFAGFAEGIRQGEFNATTTDLEDLLGRKPTSIKTFLEQTYA